MKKIEFLLLFLLLFLFSCVEQKTERIKIIDNNGNPIRLNKIVPKFNEEQLIKQKNALNQNNNQVNKFLKDYNNLDNVDTNINTSIIKENASLNNNIRNNQNNYPDNIFEDRITNYAYINNNKIIEKNNNIKEDIFFDENFNNFEKIEQKIPKKTTEKNKILENQKHFTLKNDNSYSNIDKTQDKIAKEKPKTTPNYNNKKGFFIQIGVYSDEKNALINQKKYEKINKIIIDEYISKNIKKYKLLMGSYKTKKEAEKDLEKIIKTGHYDVYIIEIK